MSADTIVALSSGGLPAGVAVLRLSGPQAGAIAGELAGGLPAPRVATLRPLRDRGDDLPLLAGAIDTLWQWPPSRLREMGEAGHARVAGISWDRVIDVLTLGGLGAALLFFALIVPPPS